eukprot:jgi/Psemu1/213886/e_gw1.663.22.1
MVRQQHYVFGYGSLICAKSRAATSSALGESKDASTSTSSHIPVRLKNWVRLWNLRGPNTYLGVRNTNTNTNTIANTTTNLSSDHSCVGVLVPLPSGDHRESDQDVLEALDHRERGYDRQRVDLGSIERVDDLLLSGVATTNEHEHEHERDSSGSSSSTSLSSELCYQAIEDRYYKHTFLRRTMGPAVVPAADPPSSSSSLAAPSSSSSSSSSNGHSDAGHSVSVCVWIYVPKDCYSGMARPENPILQSYVDVCLRGCLSISVCFAREFVLSTYGWYPGHEVLLLHSATSDGNGNCNGKEVDSGDECCWINDRETPVYIRADKTFSIVHSQRLDAVFDPLLLEKRR